MPDPAAKLSASIRQGVGYLAGRLKLAIGILLVLMVVLNAANAVGRYVFHRSINGADEILVYAMVWLVFLGAAAVTWEARHLRIGFLAAKLPERLQVGLNIIQILTLAGLCLLVCVQSIDVIGQLGKIGQRSMAAEIPMTVPHTAIALGLGLCVLFACLRLFVPIETGSAAIADITLEPADTPANQPASEDKS